MIVLGAKVASDAFIGTVAVMIGTSRRDVVRYFSGREQGASIKPYARRVAACGGAVVLLIDGKLIEAGVECEA
jgi:hypothetical protein